MENPTKHLKARPILFSTPMVQALLAGRKTQTRRVIKPQPFIDGNNNLIWNGVNYGQNGAGVPHIKKLIEGKTVKGVLKPYCPYGFVGDLIYVRETLGLRSVINHTTNKIEVWAYYKASNENEVFRWNGRNNIESIPSIHMPRFASRLTLEITDIQVERLQDISEKDCMSEGLKKWPHKDDYAFGYDGGWKAGHATPTGAYRALWESINGDTSWGVDPWVWVVEFKVHECNVDQFLKQQEQASE